jgi:hypothetical protein
MVNPDVEMRGIVEIDVRRGVWQTGVPSSALRFSQLAATMRCDLDHAVLSRANGLAARRRGDSNFQGVLGSR